MASNDLIWKADIPIEVVKPKIEYLKKKFEYLSVSEEIPGVAGLAKFVGTNTKLIRQILREDIRSLSVYKVDKLFLLTQYNMNEILEECFLVDGWPEDYEPR